MHTICLLLRINYAIAEEKQTHFSASHTLTVTINNIASTTLYRPSKPAIGTCQFPTHASFFAFPVT